jgi:anti-sigma B factor antagonist
LESQRPARSEADAYGFAVLVDRVGDRVRLVGELDVDTVTRLDRALAGHDPAEGRMVLDLDDLYFVDSTGLSALLKLHRRLAEQGACLALREIRPNVRRTIVAMGLHHVFDLDPDPTAAEVPAMPPTAQASTKPPVA